MSDPFQQPPGGEQQQLQPSQQELQALSQLQQLQQLQRQLQQAQGLGPAPRLTGRLVLGPTSSSATGTQMPNLNQNLASSSSCTSFMNITDEPGPHDVLLGRGGETNNHNGNIKFRALVSEYKDAYRDAPKIEKPVVARKLVAHWRSLDPPGRFLQKTGGPTSALWMDVGDKNAQKRASKSLGERDKPSKRSAAAAAATAQAAVQQSSEDPDDMKKPNKRPRTTSGTTSNEKDPITQAVVAASGVRNSPDPHSKLPAKLKTTSTSLQKQQVEGIGTFPSQRMDPGGLHELSLQECLLTSTFNHAMYTTLAPIAIFPGHNNNKNKNKMSSAISTVSSSAASYSSSNNNPTAGGPPPQLQDIIPTAADLVSSVFSSSGNDTTSESASSSEDGEVQTNALSFSFDNLNPTRSADI